ncbi:MAG: DNA repair protein RecN, partial [Pseudohongiellaceae bacterium]
MLTQLVIRNYAIVDALEIQFRSGMSVITGETGAGKSIILGALGLTLGDRADTSVVRSGTGKAEISAEFVIADYPEVKRWLHSNDLTNSDAEECCLLRRVVSDDGRSKAYINGTPVTLTNLSELGDMLMDIHSQHEHQSLLKRSTHQKLLDEFGVEQSVLSGMHDTWRQWHTTGQQITALSQRSEEQNAQLELIGYQVNELNELALAEGEQEKLEIEFAQLNSADSTIATLQQVMNLCQDDDNSNLSRSLNHAIALLEELPHKSDAVQTAAELFNNALIQVDEAGTELRHQLDRLEINPARLEEVNQRLADIHRVARKHRVKAGELTALHKSLQLQLSRFENADQELEILAKQEKALREQYDKLAARVSTQRQSAARKLSQQINKQLQTLGMSEAKLEVALIPVTADSLSVNGRETVEFLVSTNPGQAAKPLIKIASGGELSRISLAIQVITARTSRTPTLVFDEVDVGIGGGVAREVGKLLRQLGEHAQIICVTHQAQVAGQGHQHYFVSKHSSGKSTRSVITELTGETKIREVARMLGGE